VNFAWSDYYFAARHFDFLTFCGGDEQKMCLSERRAYKHVMRAVALSAHTVTWTTFYLTLNKAHVERVTI
jgi:hypothetical protein